MKDNQKEIYQEINGQYYARIQEIKSVFSVPVTDKEQLERLKQMGYEAEGATSIPQPQTAKEALNQAENLYGEIDFELLKRRLLLSRATLTKEALIDESKAIKSLLEKRPDRIEYNRQLNKSTTDFSLVLERFNASYYDQRKPPSNELQVLGKVIGHKKYFEWLKIQLLEIYYPSQIKGYLTIKEIALIIGKSDSSAKRLVKNLKIYRFTRKRKDGFTILNKKKYYKKSDFHILV